MRIPNRRYFTLAAPILAAVAIVGYLIGLRLVLGLVRFLGGREQA